MGDDIFIGENCNIATNVHFINETHEIGSRERRAGKGFSQPIYVGDGSWIGADCIIMPGVHIGDGCVIGAGSLVLNDTQEDSVYVGRPARRIKALPSEKT